MLHLLSLTAVVALAIPVLGSHQNHRRHAELAERLEANTTTLSKRSFSGIMTWYPTDTGPDDCTGKNHQADSWVIALSYLKYDGGAYCGQQVQINYGGKSTVVTVTDDCPSCYGVNDIDATPGLFEYFAGNLGADPVEVTWSFVDAEEATTTKKQEVATTHKSTATHKSSTTTTHISTSTSTRTHTSSTTTSSSQVSSTSHTSSTSLASTTSSATATSSASSSSSTDSATTTGIAANVGGIAGGVSTGESNGAVSRLSFSGKAGATLVLLVFQLL